MSEVYRISQTNLDGLPAAIDEACRRMEEHYAGGRYSKVTVVRHWSKHNPTISGKIARPTAYRWYLRRELLKLAERGAEIEITPSQMRIDLHSPSLLTAIDESNFDQTLKKVFLFGPERVELSLERLEHYTGTRAEDFQRYVLLTNYQMHMDAFRQLHPSAIASCRSDVQMPTLHSPELDSNGITIVNIGVGPSNAKNFTDHLAVLRPHCWVMLGHCAGLRASQVLGEYVLADGYVREDHVLDDDLPKWVPVPPIAEIQQALQQSILHIFGKGECELKSAIRTGTVHTTDNRNWELQSKALYERFRQSRAIAVDMESATVAANGFRFRVPYGTLLCVSDKPIHGEIKLQGMANSFYQKSVSQHLKVGLEAVRLLREAGVEHLHSRKLRGFSEPPFR